MNFSLRAYFSNYRILFLILFLSLNCFAQDASERTPDCDDKDYDCLIAKYTQEIQNDPKNSEAYYNRGRLYEKRANYNKAIKNFSKAIELNPEYSEAYYHRARSYDLLKQHNLALNDLNKIVELYPEEDQYLQEAFAKTYKKLGDFERYQESQKKGINTLTKKIEENPDVAGYYLKRARIYNTIGEYNKSLEDHNKAIELKPSTYSYYYSRGQNYYNMGFYYEAIEDFNLTIENNPNDSEAYFNRSRAYLKIGEKEKADSDLKKFEELSNKP